MADPVKDHKDRRTALIGRAVAYLRLWFGNDFMIAHRFLLGKKAVVETCQDVFSSRAFD